MGESWQANAGAQVGKQAEVLAQGQQGPTFRLYLRWQRLPFRASHRAK